MKSNMNMRIIKLAMAEIVMQCGFERISEQALNIMSDVFRHYLEQMAKRMNLMGETHVCFEVVARAIINDFLVEDSYQNKELFNFLHTQLQQKKYLGEKIDDDSLLHTLKVIPKSVDLTNVCRNTAGFSLVPNIKNGSSNVSLEVDPQMDDFINGCLSERSRRVVVGDNKYKLLEILSGEDLGKGEMTKEVHQGILKKRPLVNVPQSILTDYDYRERRKIFKRK